MWKQSPTSKSRPGSWNTYHTHRTPREHEMKTDAELLKQVVKLKQDAIDQHLAELERIRDELEIAWGQSLAAEADAKYWKKQSKMYAAEVSRLKLYKLCEVCKCRNYHEKGCVCHKEPPKPRGDGL